MKPDIISTTAVQDFRHARRQAALKDVLARLTGKSVGLLSYEQVREKLKVREASKKGLEAIPVGAIIGSVGRYSDFTRDFLPKLDTIEDRWVRVKVAVTERHEIPPIEVYKIGEAYFVLDGNHRVSVARQMGAKHIPAYVTELKTKVPLTPDDELEDIIIKSEYAEFLERTHLDELRPGADLSVSIPGKYRLLEEQIQTHRYFLSLEEDRQISYQEAVTHWYDSVYIPVILAIRGQGIMREFPDRTETDLYLWVTKHRSTIELELGWDIALEAAATDLAAQFSERPESKVTRLGSRLLDAMLPDELEAGPPPGDWRRMKRRRTSDPLAENRLFLDLLVPVNGQPDGWPAVEQAIIIAQREDARLHGLNVVASEDQLNTPALQALQLDFRVRCEAAGVPGQLAFAVGPIARQICDRSRWADLMVLNLAHPPGPEPISRLSSGFSTLIRRCPRPLLAVPGRSTSLDRALLAYDGSPKGDEALYVAAYVASQWQIPLVVLTAAENGSAVGATLEGARNYLDSRAVPASYVTPHGDVAGAILETAGDHGSDLIIMGGYGYKPVMEVMLGSVVDQVLRASKIPVLICR
jgi:nucleotide-binding universal stress UspA family protein